MPEQPPIVRLQGRLREARRSLTVTLAVLLGLLLLMLVVGIGVSRAINQSATEEYIEDAIPLQASVLDLVLQTYRQQNSVRGFLLTADEAPLANYRAGRRAVAEDLRFIRSQLGTHPLFASILADAEPQIDRLQSFLELQIRRARAGPAQLQVARDAAGVGERYFADFRVSADRMLADTERFVRESQGDQQRLTDILTVSLIALGGLAIAAALRVSIVVRRRVATLLEDLDDERALSSLAAARAEALQRVTAALAPALDDEAVVSALTAEAPDAAGIDEIVLARLGPGGRHLERVSLTGRTAARDRSVPIDDEGPIATAVRTGEPAFHTGDTLPAPDGGRGASWAVLPLRAHAGGVAGALALRFDDVNDFGPGERTFVLTLGDQVAQALDRVRLHQEQQQISQVLQRSLLPRALPEIAGVQMAARYVAAASGQEVGGDFYDVFEDDRGHLAVMVGDACGKGPEAVALTALARYTVRAVSDGDGSPARALGRLNDAMRQQGFGTLFMTAALLGFRRENEDITVTTCRAGHPFPLLVRASGEVEELGGPGTILGVFADPRLVEVTTPVAPGDTVVVFTDGLTEARQGTALLGEERLRAAAALCAGMDVEAAASHLLRTAADFAGGGLRDDVAVVVVRLGRP